MSQSPDISERHKRIIERIISLTLQIGVITSVALVLLGATLTFIHHPEYVTDPATLGPLTGPHNDFPTTPHDVFEGVLAFRGQAIIVLGLMVLLATPVLRVAISVFIFLAEKDTRFVFVTLLVLALLFLSFFLGKAEM